MVGVVMVSRWLVNSILLFLVGWLWCSVMRVMCGGGCMRV